MTTPQPPYGNSWPAPPHPPKRPRLGLAARIGLIFGGIVVLGIAVGLSNQDDLAPVTQSSAATTSAPRPTYSPPTYRAPAAPVTPLPIPVPSGPPQELSSREWALIAKSPDKHVGKLVVVYGRVTQFDSVTGSSSFRASLDGARHDQWYEYDTNAILTASSGELLAEVVQDDTFRAEVTVLGTYSYTTTMGGALTVPQLRVEKIQIL